MNDTLANTLRNPHFQAKTLMILLALAWMTISLLAGDSVLLYLLITPHLLLACLVFIPKRTVINILVFFVGLEIAILVYISLLSRWEVEKFVIIIFILLCGRALYALIRASIWIENLESAAQHGFEPVMKAREAIPMETMDQKSNTRDCPKK